MTDDELLEALRKRGTDPHTPFRPAASPADLDRAEERLGLRIPPLLRRIYVEIADGGFGPGAGLLPIAGPGTARDRGVIETFERFGRPRPLMPFVDFGCACWALVDTRSDDGKVILLHRELIDNGRSLRAFLDDWTSLDDFDTTIFEPDGERAAINPFTKKTVMMRVPGPARGIPWPEAATIPGLGRG